MDYPGIVLHYGTLPYVVMLTVWGLGRLCAFGFELELEFVCSFADRAADQEERCEE